MHPKKDETLNYGVDGVFRTVSPLNGVFLIMTKSQMSKRGIKFMNINSKLQIPHVNEKLRTR